MGNILFFLQIYYPQTFNKDLNQRVSDYLDCYSKVELESSRLSNEHSREQRTLRLPELVERYEKFIGKNADYNNAAHNQSCQNIFSVTDYLSKSEKTVFKYEPAVNSYEILIKYEQLDATKVDPTMKRSSNSSCRTSSTWTSRSTKPNVLQYLEGHCWLLSYLVKRVHKESSPMLESVCCDDAQRTACFESNSTSPWISTLATALFDDNAILASIQEHLSLPDLWAYLEKCLREDRIQDCLDVINALPCKLLTKCTEMQCLKDKLLCQLIHKSDNSSAENILRYIYQIKDINVLAQTILAHINEWPVHLCQDALFHALHHSDKHKLPSHCRFKMNETLCRVTVFYKMLPYCKDKEVNSKEATWYDVIYCTEKTDPACIIQSLVEADKFELCLEWLEYQALSSEIQSLVTQDLLVGLLKNDESDFKNARKVSFFRLFY